MLRNTYFALLFVLPIFGCASMPSGTEIVTASSEDTGSLSLPSVEHAEEGMARYSVPVGSYVIGIDETVNRLILGSQTSQRILFLDLETQAIDAVDVSFIPAVGIDIGPELGIAVFGFKLAGQARGYFQDRSSRLATTKFAIIHQGEVFERELAEPIVVADGVLWQERQSLILLDGSEYLSSIATINLERMYYGEDPIRIGRRPLKMEPYDLAIVGWRHLVLSYVDDGIIEILDLDSFQSLGFADPTKTGTAALVESLDVYSPEHFASFSFEEDYVGKEPVARFALDVHELSATRGFSVERNVVWTERSAITSRRAYDDGREQSSWGALHGMRVGEGFLLLAGYANQLYVSPRIDVHSYAKDEYTESQTIDLQVKWISRIDSTVDSQRVFVSSPDDGVVVAVQLESLYRQ